MPCMKSKIKFHVLNLFQVIYCQIPFTKPPCLRDLGGGGLVDVVVREQPAVNLCSCSASTVVVLPSLRDPSRPKIAPAGKEGNTKPQSSDMSPSLDILQLHWLGHPVRSSFPRKLSPVHPEAFPVFQTYPKIPSPLTTFRNTSRLPLLPD